MKMFFSKRRGFSVIELLIVVFLIVIALTTVMVIINPIKRKAQAEDYKRFNDVMMIAQAIKSYMYRNMGEVVNCEEGIPIPDDDEWRCIGTGECLHEYLTENCDIGLDLIPSYLDELPNDPTTSNMPNDSGYAIMRESGSNNIFIGVPYTSKYRELIMINVMNLQ